MNQYALEKLTVEDLELIKVIVDRTKEEYNFEDLNGLTLDITHVHCQAGGLKLKELSEAKGYDFFHDVFGIYKYWNRQTYKLEKGFLPRFSSLL